MKRRKKFDVVIGGYYGFGNMGDDTVLLRLTEKIRESNPRAEIAVLVRGKKACMAKYNLACIERFNIFAVIRALWGAGAFILGGGSLFQNETSCRSLLYYAFTVHLSRLLCGGVYIYANGIGALRGNFAYRTARRALRCADRISVRDPDSYRLVSRLCGDEEKTVLTADPVFLTKTEDFTSKKPFFEALSGKRYFVVSLRETARREELPTEEITAFCRYYRDKMGLTPVFVPMQESYDGELCRFCAGECGGIVVGCADSCELLSLLSSAEFAVGMRLHFLLMALMALCPTVALSYDCKIDSSVPYAGGNHVIPVRGVTKGALVFETEAAKKDTDVQRLQNRCLELKALAVWDAENLFSAQRYGKARRRMKSKGEKASSEGMGKSRSGAAVTPW